MSYNVFVYERFKKNLYIKYKGAKNMGDVEKKQQLIEEHAYNQCSIIIRVDGEETEIPINFGMTADEIKQIYPFLLPLVNQKVENPCIEFTKKANAGAYDTLPENEYSEMVTMMGKQSKYWYDKPEASILELAMRFALDIKLRNFDDLIYLFDVSDRTDAIKPAKLSEEETTKVIREMKLETPDEYQKDAGNEHDVESSVSGKLSFNIYGSDVADEKYSQTLDDMEKKLISDDVFESIVKEDTKNIDTERYKSTYKPGRYDDSVVQDGRVNIYPDETEEEGSLFEERSDNDIEDEDALESLVEDEDFEDSDFDDEDKVSDDAFSEEDFPEDEVTEDEFGPLDDDLDAGEDDFGDGDDFGLDGDEDDFDEDEFDDEDAVDDDKKDED